MNRKKINILLLTLIIINIIDSDFSQTYVMDMFKILLPTLCLILNKKQKNESEGR